MAGQFRCLQCKWADKQLKKFRPLGYVPDFKTRFCRVASGSAVFYEGREQIKRLIV